MASVVGITTQVADRLNPVTGGPAAPLKASALLDSYGPSLMPRSSVHQGLAAGLALLAANGVGLAVDMLARRVAPADSPLAWRIGKYPWKSPAATAMPTT